MSKKMLVVFLAIVMAAGMLFASCKAEDEVKEEAPANTEAAQKETTTEDNEQTEEEKIADPLGKYEEAVTLVIAGQINPADKTLPEGDSIEDCYYTRFVKENLNIDIEYDWVTATTDFEQKVSLIIASNDLPDAMIVPTRQFMQLARNGQLQDLSTAYNDYASADLKTIIDKTEGAAIDTVSLDGKMLGIPYVENKTNNIQMMWIRKDWLDILGMDVPTNIEELEAVATAFVEQNPGGNEDGTTIAITGPQSGAGDTSLVDRFGFGPIFNAFESYPTIWVNRDGQAEYGSISPETKEALAKLQDWYAKGLIDPEMGLREDATEPIIAGLAGIHFGPWWQGYSPITDTVRNNPEANFQAYASPLDSDGDFNTKMSSVTNQVLVVRDGYEYPEAVVKIVNLALENGGEIDGMTDTYGDAAYYWPLRMVLANSDDNEVTNQALKDVLNGVTTPDDYTTDEFKFYSHLYSDVSAAFDTKLEPYDNFDIQYWNTESEKFARLYSKLVGGNPLLAERNEVYSIIYFNTPTMDKKWANLQKLEAETFYKIIMGGASIDTFDDFVEQWKKEGGDEITAEVQEYVK